MKRFPLLLTALLCSISLSAQSQMRLWRGEESTRINLSDASVITYSNNGTELTIAGTKYSAEEIDSLVLIHQVSITFNEDTVTYQIPAAIADDITITTDKGYATVTNTNIWNEIEFKLSGESSNGGFTYYGAFKATFRLNGLTLTSQRGAAIDILCGKRSALILEDGTTNTLADYSAGEQKACLYCKGHMEVEGRGTLNVSGNLSHAIKTKEYLQLKKSTGTINIVKASGDGVHAGQYYQQNGGTITITSDTHGDGIQAEVATLDDDVTPSPDKEYNGRMFINGGTLNIEAAHEDRKGIKCDSLITITGGTIKIAASGNGSRGIQTSSNMIIGTSGGDTTSPTITISATGGLCTAEEDSDDPHRCMGIKVDGNLTVYSGTTVVTNTGSKSRGIKVGGTYSKKGGNVTANIKN